MTADIIALICALGTDPSACQPDVARATTILESNVPETKCTKPEFNSALAKFPDLFDAKAEYAKVVCAPHRASLKNDRF
jgi:hypothetical protein